MIKTLAVSSIALAGLVIASMSIASDKIPACPYDNVTGDWHDPVTGQISAYGTMDDAADCAYNGLLPKVVRDRLGTVGDARTKKDAKLILKLHKNASK